jgi:hypothetical protein
MPSLRTDTALRPRNRGLRQEEQHKNDSEHSHLLQITHHSIGLLAVIMACGRELELRLTPPAGRLGGAVFMSALLVVGLILLFYCETPVSSG